jgi:hypothetical protein
MLVGPLWSWSYGSCIGSYIYNYLYVPSVHITTKIVSSNPVHDQVYSMQHFVIKIVSDLWQVVGFLWVLRFPSPIKLTATI